MNRLSHIIPNQLCDLKLEDILPDETERAEVAEHAMIVKKLKALPVEAIVRGYIIGSGWKDYQTNGSICGIKLPQGLKESDKLPEPLFTPSTKEEIGLHDVNIDFDTVVNKIGEILAEKVRKLSLAIYQKGADLAYEKDIIIADTKFEFGIFENNLILIDEVLTPDSSRFWPRKSYKPDGAQKSFDKQYLRDHLISLNWGKKPPGPSLPENVIRNTRSKYLEALNQLTDASYAL